MSQRATGAFENKSWSEDVFAETAGAPRLTRSSMIDTFHGDIEGEATVEYLGAYHPGGSYNFVGLGRVQGSLSGREGTFALQQSGEVKDDRATATWTVVPGSGTGGLRGLSGTGGYTWDRREGPGQPYTLDYDLSASATPVIEE